MRTEIVNSINNTTRSNMSAIDKWEYLKIRCKANAQLYSRQKAREKTDLINNFHRLRYELLHEQCVKVRDDDENLHIITKKIQDLEKRKGLFCSL